MEVLDIFTYLNPHPFTVFSLFLLLCPACISPVALRDSIRISSVITSGNSSHLCHQFSPLCHKLPYFIKDFSHLYIFLQLFPISLLTFMAKLFEKDVCILSPVFLLLFFCEHSPVSAFVSTIPPKLFLSRLPVTSMLLNPKINSYLIFFSTAFEKVGSTLP